MRSKRIWLDLLVEALAGGSNCSQNVHQEAVVRILIEHVLLGFVIKIKLRLDEFEDLEHELYLVELVEAGA